MILEPRVPTDEELLAQAAAAAAMAAAALVLTTSAPTVYVQAFDASGTFTAPVAGDYTIDSIGPGGGGGPIGSPGGGGGGAGARARSVKTLAAGAFAVVVGTGGAPQVNGSGPSTFDAGGAAEVSADFGLAAIDRTGGTGGLTVSCIGDVVLTGGDGGTSDATGGAGGGGSPTFDADGLHGDPNSGALGGPGGVGEGPGGAGADGGEAEAAETGLAPGAGGGGGSDAAVGGSGADGRVTITRVGI